MLRIDLLLLLTHAELVQVTDLSLPKCVVQGVSVARARKDILPPLMKQVLHFEATYFQFTASPSCKKKLTEIVGSEGKAPCDSTSRAVSCGRPRGSRRAASRPRRRLLPNRPRRGRGQLRGLRTQARLQMPCAAAARCVPGLFGHNGMRNVRNL